jgi:hypothetical protein
VGLGNGNQVAHKLQIIYYVSYSQLSSKSFSRHDYLHDQIFELNTLMLLPSRYSVSRRRAAAMAFPSARVRSRRAASAGHLRYRATTTSIFHSHLLVSPLHVCMLKYLVCILYIAVLRTLDQCELSVFLEQMSPTVG